MLFLAATHRDLDEMVEKDEFRRDLLARLSQTCIDVPALRERSEDLFSIVLSLWRRANLRQVPLDSVEVEAVERLMLEPWPSNVRELESVLARVRTVDTEPGLRLCGSSRVTPRLPCRWIARWSMRAETRHGQRPGSECPAGDCSGSSRRADARDFTVPRSSRNA